MTTTTTTPVRTYEIDKAHSEAVFQVRHLLTKVSGRFEDFKGAVRFDEAAPAESSIDFTIQAASINTNQPDRDAHLRSADFFDVERFPTLTFVSRSVEARGDRRFDVAGDLTIHGISRSVTLPVTYLGAARDPWGNERAGFETEVRLNRRDFGLTWNAALETGGFLVGDDVRVTVSMQAIGK